jgi:hypothetical protein
MKNVQEKVWMTVAKRAYQMVGLSMDSACLSMEEGMDLSIAVQALGIF